MWLETSHLTFVCWPNHGHPFENLTKFKMPFRSTNHNLFHSSNLGHKSSNSSSHVQANFGQPFKPSFSIFLFQFHYLPHSFHLHPKTLTDLASFYSKFPLFFCDPSRNLKTTSQISYLWILQLQPQGEKRETIIILEPYLKETTKELQFYKLQVVFQVGFSQII